MKSADFCVKREIWKVRPEVLAFPGKLHGYDAVCDSWEHFKK